MKIPRNLNADELIQCLSKVGYVPTRQTGSHIRLTTEQNGQHHITVPQHNPMRIGTLSAILNSVAAHLGIEKQELVVLLF